MPSYPSITFTTIPDWENYLNTEIITNGIESITGLIGNNAYNGAVTFIKKSPLNWAKISIYSSAGAIPLDDNFLGTALFLVTPSSLTFGDNFYNEYVLINMTDNDIPLGNNQVYYNLNSQPIDIIPARTAVTIMKAQNDLWVAVDVYGQSTSSNGQPNTFVVGTTVGAPVAGTNTWTNPAFIGKWVSLFLSRSILIDFIDVGDGGFFLSPKVLNSDTITINNYTWTNGDILSYILT